MPVRALVGGRVLRGVGLEPEDANITMRDGLIADIQPRAAAVPHDVEVIDVSGMTVLPGLIDCHVHLVLSGSAEGAISHSEALSETTVRAAEAAWATVSAGFTTVRDLGGRDYVELSLRRSIERGGLVGPRLVCGCKLISITCSAGDGLPGMFREADGVDEVRKAVREQLKAGADVIKIMGSGAVMALGQNPSAAHFTCEELRAAVHEAHREGKRVAVHAHGAEAGLNAVEAGVDSIEHGTFLHQDEAVLERMARDCIFLVPTLSFHRRIVEHGTSDGIPAHMVDAALAAADDHVRSFRRALELGVPVAFGTDSGSPFCVHGENARELDLMVESGMSPADAVRAATSTAASCLGLDGLLGSIERGKAADLVVVEGDPLVDVSCLRTAVRAVLRAGNVISAHDKVMTGSQQGASSA